MSKTNEEATVFKKIEHKIPALMQQLKIPGLAVSVIKDNQIVYSAGFGARNLQKNLPFTPDTLIGIGSVTKSFTGLAILKLVEEGKLSLDNPMNLKYSSLAKVRVPLGSHRPTSSDCASTTYR